MKHTHAKKINNKTTIGRFAIQIGYESERLMEQKQEDDEFRNTITGNVNEGKFFLALLVNRGRYTWNLLKNNRQ